MESSSHRQHEDDTTRRVFRQLREELLLASSKTAQEIMQEEANQRRRGRELLARQEAPKRQEGRWHLRPALRCYAIPDASNLFIILYSEGNNDSKEQPGVFFSCLNNMIEQ
jgi:hypothetical protein